MAIDNEATCLKCGRDGSRCICEIEFVHGPAYGEHRGSRPGVDPFFTDAVFKEFAPDEEALEEKEAT